MKNAPYLAFSLALLLAACSGGEGEAPLNEEGGPVEAFPSRALQIQSEDGCVIDDDCAAGRFCFQNTCAWMCEDDADCATGVCSPTGRCETTAGLAFRVASAGQPLIDALPNLRIVSHPEMAPVITANDETVTFEFGLSATMPDEGIPYRVRRDDGVGDATQVRFATGTDTFSITVDTGAARPGGDQEARPVSMTIFSAVGNFDVVLRPQPSFEGVWVGDLAIDSFGGAQGFELRARVVGNDSEELHLVLPVDNANLFSPRHVDGSDRDFEMAPLEYRASTDTYQAIFTHAFEFDDGIFADHAPTQVARTLRFDFDASRLEDGFLEGRFADVWSGLHTTQRTNGDLEVGTLNFIGTFVLDRVGDLDRPADSFTLSDAGTPQPDITDLGVVEACQDSDLLLDSVQVGEQTYHCDGITTLANFLEASPEAQASCALAMSATVAAGDTTAKQIALYFAEEPGPQGLSFEAFLQSCADDEDSTCSPAERSGCAYELVSLAAQNIHRGTIAETERVNVLLSELMVALSEMSSEAFLARQIGAFYNDMELRRQWLRSGAAPAVFLDAVETANQEMMTEWRAQVLDVHQGVFSSFYTQDAITFLGRTLSGELPNERRRALLAEAGVLWRGYAEGLQLAASRWNESVRDQEVRDAHVDFLNSRALELYLTLGLLNDFNRAAGSSFQSAGLAGGFTALTRSIGRLSTSFQDAIFARDAEVVTARSLNPLVDNSSLLRERKTRATTTLETARETIEEILNDVSIEAVAEQDFRARMSDQRNQSANRIAELCGLPPGCTETDLYTDPSCLNVEVGECGLLDPGNSEVGATFDPARVAASEGGRAVLAILEAYQNIAIQSDEFDTHLAKLDLQHKELEAFRDDINHWNELRLEGIERLQENIEARGELRDTNTEILLGSVKAHADARRGNVESMRADIAEAHNLRVLDSMEDFGASLLRLQAQRSANQASSGLRFTASLLNATAEGLPTTVGTSNDVSAPARATLALQEQTLNFSADTLDITAQYAIDNIDNVRALTRNLITAERQRMADVSAADAADAAADLADLEDAVRRSENRTSNEIAALTETLEILREEQAADLAFRRDYATYREKRTAFLQNLTETAGHALRVERTRFNVLQRFLEYDAVVQAARLEASRLAEIDRRFADLDTLVGGLGAIFSQTYVLERSESYLNQARSALMDWLVILEYYAVRPFIAERIQIQLARNAYQLEAIANRLIELESTCGGSERSTSSATLSLRRDVLGIDLPQQSSTDEAVVISADDRFREWLSQSYVSVDRRIRFSTSDSLTQVLDGSSEVLATTFPLRLDHFANLGLACNAKIESLAVNLVGDLGDVAPTVTVLYDGTSQLRSCQPNIEDYVQAFGAGMTSYGSTTNLRTAGRPMSPLAGVNGFPDSGSSVNRTLAGLPVASEYTLLISTERGDNARVNWENLEDIEIRVEYSYQDLFPTACD